jgi:hypothetical protein
MKETLDAREKSASIPTTEEIDSSRSCKLPESEEVRAEDGEFLREGELEKIRQEIKLDNLPESPFETGEIFDPEAELKKVSVLKGEEKKTGLKSFKKKLNYQKKGLALIEVKSLDLIKKNPGITKEELEESIKDIESKLALTKLQSDAIRTAFSNYSMVHKTIEEYAADFMDEDGDIDGPGLYKMLFQREPSGRVNVIIRPFSIFFRVENLEDYSHVAFQSYEGKDNWIIYKIRDAKKEGGAKVDYDPIPGLKDSIIIENCAPETGGKKSFDDEGLDVNDTLLHEERHAYNDLFARSYDAEAHFTRNRSKEDLKYERFVKSEISAYFKCGRENVSIHKALLDKNTLYRYGFAYKNPGSSMDESYIRLVEDGISSFDSLMDFGLSVDEVQAILFKEPLAKWKTTVERTVGFQMDPLTYEESKRDLRAYTKFSLPVKKRLRLFVDNLGSLVESIRSKKSIRKGYKDYSLNRKRKI